MRRPARLLVALGPAVLILAACGSSADSADSADTGTAAPEAAESSASSEAPLNEDAVIVYSGRSEDLVTPLLESSPPRPVSPSTCGSATPPSWRPS